MKLKDGEMYICKCSDFCEEGFVLAIWNGTKFYTSVDHNEEINDYITEYAFVDPYEFEFCEL